MATASNYYVHIKLANNDTRLVRLESSRDFDNVVEFVMRHDPEAYPLRSKVYFTFDKNGTSSKIASPLELHHAIHLDKSHNEQRLELQPAVKH